MKIANDPDQISSFAKLTSLPQSRVVMALMRARLVKGHAEV
jgi:hypothetical protein